MRGVETVLFLVVVATIVATFARRLRVPAPSLLVVAGLVAGLLPGVSEIQVTPDVVGLVVLPPLLYAAGEELPWRDLRAVWKPVTALAVGLVIASAAAVGGVVVAITGLPIGLALVLGTVLASTDPVAVSALGRRLSLPPRVRALVQAESLFNDATSLLLFRVAVAAAVTVGAVSWSHVAVDFVVLAGGGAAIGLVVGWGVVLIRGRIADPVLETVVALVTPYLAYVAAESVHGSGVTAVVVASVLIGARTAGRTAPRIRIQIDAVYQTVVFLLESVVFALIGLELPTLVRALSRQGPTWLLQALAITATLIVVRALWVFPMSALTARGSARKRSWRVPAVVSWAGARGVVPLAAALSIPLTTDSGAPLPGRDLILLLATAVIVITLVVQGFTLAPLVRRAGVAQAPADLRHEDTVARLHVARAGLDHLEELADSDIAPDGVVDQLRVRLQAHVDRIEADRAEDGAAEDGSAVYRRLRRDILAVQRDELARLFQVGTIGDSTRRRVERDLDLEDARLGEDL
ncbi:MAG TPA: Na+/H+ antiporter [Pseudonocardiaceae bacterium]|jgi:CPA1 family monovalent cation:H+ antiporter|nr:Na+/H+ antiporter [Pseudonocardiaceae bacterium]